jgi:cobaltochelatase CobS
MKETLVSAQDFSASIRRKSIAAPTGQPGELKIDPHFEEDPNATKVIEFAIKRRKNAFIVGPTGCGKSSLVLNILARMQMPAEPFSCHGETSTDELIGKLLITEGPNGQPITSVAYGAAVRAYKLGKILLLEEVDHAAPDILSALHRIMETHQNYYIANVGSQEIIQKNPNFCVIATANTIGTGEDTFLYAGTKPLNAATMNRFGLVVRMGYLAPEKEVKVLKAKTGVNEKVAETMVQAANDARDAADPTRVGGTPGSQQIACAVSTRDLIEWADAVVGMDLDPREAAQYAFLNRVMESDRDVIKTFIENRCS